MFAIGDRVRVCNVDLESYSAVGDVMAVGATGAQVSLIANLPDVWSNGRLVTYSNKSLERVASSKKRSPKTNIGIFFDEREKAKEFLVKGDIFSQDSEFDVVAADTLADCEKYYEGLDSEYREQIEVLVFKGVMYEVKTIIKLVEVEED